MGGQSAGSTINPMNQIVATSFSELGPASEDQQFRFVRGLMAGKSPSVAAREAGTDTLSLYFARCADTQFDDLWNLALLAVRDAALHQILDKALVATGTVVWDNLTDDKGEPYLDEQFEPIRAPRLLNSNTAILSKLLDRLMVSADKPVPSAVVQINNSNQVDNGALQPMPRLINPSEDDDHD